jgi:hypothetical protein
VYGERDNEEGAEKVVDVRYALLQIQPKNKEKKKRKRKKKKEKNKLQKIQTQITIH